MESIVISDPAFSLETDALLGGGSGDNYTIFLYIGLAVLAGFIAFFAHKYYKNKHNNNLYTEAGQLDCEGGFCNMRDRPNQHQVHNQP